MNKKNLLVILMAGMMLATIFSAVSVNAAPHTYVSANSGSPTGLFVDHIYVFVYTINPDNNLPYPVSGESVKGTDLDWGAWTTATTNALGIADIVVAYFGHNPHGSPTPGDDWLISLVDYPSISTTLYDVESSRSVSLLLPWDLSFSNVVTQNNQNSKSSQITQQYTIISSTLLGQTTSRQSTIN